MSSEASRTRKLSLADLTEQQQAAIDRLYEHDATLLVAGVGFGKAVVGLTALQELIEAGTVRRVLVLAPLRVATLTWGSEPAIWSHIRDDLVAVACGTPKQRLAAAESGAPVVVTNFENLDWILDVSGGDFDACLVDEISKCKSAGGNLVRRLRRWMPKLAWRAGMSANPVAESGVDIYAQALLLDGGAALGTRKDAFLQRYMAPLDFQQRQWDWRPGGVEAATQALGGLVWRADDAGYRDALPALRVVRHAVELDATGAALYAAMDDTGVAEWNGHTVLGKSAGTRTLRLHQIAAGVLYAEEAEGAVWQSTRKIWRAIELVAEAAGPVVLVYQYRAELAALKKSFPSALVLGDGNKVSAGDIDAWNRGEHPVLLMHPASAAHGINLQYGGHELILLSPIWSADAAQQVPGRLCRRGQPAAVVIQHILYAPGTVDEKALGGLEVKAEREEQVMRRWRR